MDEAWYDLVDYQLEIDQIDHMLGPEGGSHERAAHRRDGMLGSQLLANLSDGVVLSRDPRTTCKLGSVRAVRWDPATEAAPLEALQGVEAIFHALRIAFGEMSEVSMASQRALPSVAERVGYAFKHTELDGALAAVMAASSRRAA